MFFVLLFVFLYYNGSLEVHSVVLWVVPNLSHVAGAVAGSHLVQERLFVQGKWSPQKYKQQAEPKASFM